MIVDCVACYCGYDQDSHSPFPSPFHSRDDHDGDDGESGDDVDVGDDGSHDHLIGQYTQIGAEVHMIGDIY